MILLSARSAIAAMLVLWGNPVVVFADQASDVAALEAQCEAEREAKIKPLRDMEIAKCKTSATSVYGPIRPGSTRRRSRLNLPNT
jgi:hypothetical protein